ncbi:hypothetical protein JQ760_028625 (plasmid) [Klebsiella pneumoniae]|uniref:hypothetical protein n=1 Tax=Klebsiella pneumoniae TaxID=573 RepID=UPI001FAC335D|nr:hypothetical protein [Klebsiella pneumoniae]MCI8109333.1 hypothetical protein [Klebsiella pneumoniae]
MKVHVTVDESIYPELHELMEATPVSKRARVLANLAFKACLLSNAALMNAELTTPSRGRNPSKKKKNPTTTGKNLRDDSKTDKPALEERSLLDDGRKDEIGSEVSFQSTLKTGENELSNAGGESTLNNTYTPISVNSNGAGVPERDSGNEDASGQQNIADGERSGNSAPQVPNKRKRRILG